MSTTTTTVAGLPKYVTLKSKSTGKYLHCLREGGDFGPDIPLRMGCQLDLDPNNPWVKLEVVPSTSDPTRQIHLRCCFNNKFLHPLAGKNTYWLFAGADAPSETRASYTASTLFQPDFIAGHPNNTVVGLVHVMTGDYVNLYTNPSRRSDDSYEGFAELYGREVHQFEFAAAAAWDSSSLESNEEKKMKGKDDEIEKLKSSYEEKMKSKDDEIEELKSKVRERGEEDGIVGELRVEIVELKVQLEDAWKEIQELKAAAN